MVQREKAENNGSQKETYNHSSITHNHCNNPHGSNIRSHQHLGFIANIPSAGTITAVPAPPVSGGGGGIPTGGEPPVITGLGIYSNSQCTQNLTAINWGNLTPGQNTTQTIYLKNLGNTNLTLSLTASNRTPQAAAASFNFSWNREGYNLAPNASIQAILTLAVAQNPDTSIADFSFNIQILYIAA